MCFKKNNWIITQEFKCIWLITCPLSLKTLYYTCLLKHVPDFPVGQRTDPAVHPPVLSQRECYLSEAHPHLHFLPSIAPKVPILPFALARDRKRKRRTELRACFISSSTIHTPWGQRKECRDMETQRQSEWQIERKNEYTEKYEWILACISVLFNDLHNQIVIIIYPL